MLLLNICIFYARLKGHVISTRASCAGDLDFKTRAGQILHGNENGSPPLDIYDDSCVTLMLCRGEGPR